MKVFKKIIDLLTYKEKKEAGYLMLMIIIMAILDMIGVASILPFIAILTNPEIVETNIFLNKIFKLSNFVGVETIQQFLFCLGILVFLLLVISLTFKAFTSYLQVSFSEMREYSISKRLLEGYLNQPYSWFLYHNSSHASKTILSEVQVVVGQGLKPMFELIAKTLIVAALLVLLILINPKLTFIIFLVLGGAYGLIYKFVRKILNRIGEDRMKANQLRFTSVSEAFGAAKEVKVGGLEKIYSDRFSSPARKYAYYTITSNLLSHIPRYAIEAITFGGMLLILLYLMAQNGDFVKSLPTISLFAFAGYRLIPALQEIYRSLAQLRFVGSSLDRLHKDLNNLVPHTLNLNNNIMKINKSINLNNVYFQYPNSNRTTLNNISLSIAACSVVGLVGATGSGKTTTADIILGLLDPKLGTLDVDGVLIKNHNKRSWQRAIGYVPQQIYLSDDTITANIAFGKNPEQINHEVVKRVAKIANLDDFITNELPNKYKTIVGERGVRLSGGQRQRIGIARALYHNPQILILDEATSALDNFTEHLVMQAISNLKKDITIIIIAHRLNTVKECDKIFLFEKGHLIENGSYSELMEKSDKFIRLANK